MRANQLRLWFASMAYVLICALRCIAFAHTQFARATGATIRLKLLKIGAPCLRRGKEAVPERVETDGGFPLQRLWSRGVESVSTVRGLLSFARHVPRLPPMFSETRPSTPS